MRPSDDRIRRSGDRLVHRTIAYFSTVRADSPGGKPVLRMRRSAHRRGTPYSEHLPPDQDWGNPADEFPYQWGYPGGGPSTLAAAILSDALEGVRPSRRLVLVYRDAVIQHLPRERPWRIPVEDVLAFIKENLE